MSLTHLNLAILFHFDGSNYILISLKEGYPRLTLLAEGQVLGLKCSAVG